MPLEDDIHENEDMFNLEPIENLPQLDTYSPPAFELRDSSFSPTLIENNQKKDKQKKNFFYKDLIDREDLSLSEKKVPEHLIIPKTEKRKKNSTVLINNREVITLGQLYHHRLRRQQKYYFFNGEPVPAEKLTPQAIQQNRVDAKKIVTQQAILRRRYVYKHDGSELRKEEIKRLTFNPDNKNCYVDGQEVIWDNKKATWREKDNFFKQIGKSKLDHNTIQGLAKGDDSTKIETPSENDFSNPQIDNLISFTRPGLFLNVTGWVMTPQLEQDIKQKLNCIYDECRNTFFEYVEQKKLGERANQAQKLDNATEAEFRPQQSG